MKQHFTYAPSGVCAQRIDFDLEDGVVSNVSFLGGCNGNLKAISKLVDGKKAADIADILIGNTCGYKQTSCADQLSKALLQALNTVNE